MLIRMPGHLPSWTIDWASVKSSVVQAHLTKKDGASAKRGSDLVEPEELTALLSRVRHRLGELADKILDGEIGIRPYMLGDDTPCPKCEYHDVCRFESRGGYQ